MWYIWKCNSTSNRSMEPLSHQWNSTLVSTYTPPATVRCYKIISLMKHANELSKTIKVTMYCFFVQPASLSLALSQMSKYSSIAQQNLKSSTNQKQRAKTSEFVKSPCTHKFQEFLWISSSAPDKHRLNLNGKSDTVFPQSNSHFTHKSAEAFFLI